MYSTTTNSNTCIFCSKECKNSDSRPYPNSKSKSRIHNKCQIKKAVADKKQPNSDHAIIVTDGVPGKPVEANTTDAPSIVDRAIKEESELTRAINERKMNKLINNSFSKQTKNDSNPSSQFFFDLKAGIAKPHEKRSYLHHRNLCEIVARYDDNGFQDEAVGRAYDHTGKDLDTLGDSDEDHDEDVLKNKDRNDGLVRCGERSQTGHDHDKRKRDHEGEKNRIEKRHKNIRVDERNPCWFCLSSPQVEKHLILAIGDYSYLTLAKGGLSDQHFLLLPIEHIESLNSDANSRELLEELEKFKKSLIMYFSSISKGVVFFERNFKSVHWQLQVVPIPYDILDTVENDIKTVSKKHFRNSNYLDIPPNCLLSDVIPSNVPYFYWQLEPNDSRFVTEIQVKGSYFPIQFGRLVLADSKILNCPDKVDWKACAKSKEYYVDLVERTKERYRDYDIT